MSSVTELNEEIRHSAVRVLVDSWTFLISTEFVAELVDENQLTITPIPLVRNGLLGLINHRGRVVPLFDLRTLIGSQLRSKQVDELVSFLNSAIKWQENLFVELAQVAPSSTSKSSSASKSELRKWLQGFQGDSAARKRFTNGSLIMENALDTLSELHDQLSESAREIQAFKKADDLEAMNTRLDHVSKFELVQFKRVANELINECVEQMSGKALIISINKMDAALLVDSIPEVISEVDADFEGEMSNFHSETMILPSGEIVNLLTKANLLQMFDPSVTEEISVVAAPTEAAA